MTFGCSAPRLGFFPLYIRFQYTYVSRKFNWSFVFVTTSDQKKRGSEQPRCVRTNTFRSFNQFIYAAFIAFKPTISVSNTTASLSMRSSNQQLFAPSVQRVRCLQYYIYLLYKVTRIFPGVKESQPCSIRLPLIRPSPLPLMSIYMNFTHFPISENRNPGLWFVCSLYQSRCYLTGFHACPF